MSRDDFDNEEEYSSPMMAAAVGMHEMYMTLKAAGFSRRDALELIAKMLSGPIVEGMRSDDTEEDD